MWPSRKTYFHLMLAAGWLLLFGSTLALAPSTAAQSQAQTEPSAPPQKKSRETSDGGLIIREKTDLVTVTVTVTDRHQHPVTSLDRRQFEVYEDKVKQNIEFFSDEDEPASIGVIFDLSASMASKIERARAALKAFVQASHQDDDFFLVAFNGQASVLAEFTDGETLLGKLAMMKPSGRTALYDATYLGTEIAKRGRHNKRALLIITDGEDNASRYKYGELHRLLKETDVQVYCIGILTAGEGERDDTCGNFCKRQSEMTLEELAQSTGGQAFFPLADGELEDAITRIALELRHQYSLGYVPTRPPRDGQWRKIKVQVNPPPNLSRVMVHAKEGYYAIQ